MREKKSVVIDCFNNLENSSKDVIVEKFYNYYPDRKLKNSKGVDVAKFPRSTTNTTEDVLNISNVGITSVEGVAYFKQYFPAGGTTAHRLLVYAGDNKVYINQMMDDSYDLYWLYNLTFSSAPITLAYKKDDADAIILASESEMKIWKTNYSPYTIENAPIITSMCMNEGVLFCSIKEPAFKIWYATDLDAENVGNISSNSGYISLEDDLGYARKVITFDEDVYVFRDYGISKISFVKGDISVSQIYLSNTKIYSNTISICGNVILFMTKEGLMSFNGVKVARTKVEFLTDFQFENGGAVASSLGDKYYLALRVDFKDENQILCENEDFINNCLLVVDSINFSYEIIRGVDVKAMLPVKTEMFEKMLLVFNSGHTDSIGEIIDKPKYFDDVLPKYWSSCDLVDNFKTKLFTKLSVCADSGVTFKLKYDGKQMNFTTYKSGINEFLFKICSKDMKLEISSSTESAFVERVVLDYYEY